MIGIGLTKFFAIIVLSYITLIAIEDINNSLKK